MFSGIRTDKMKFLIYVLCRCNYRICGIYQCNQSRIGYIFQVVTIGGKHRFSIALVLGGMPISGGAKVRFENIVVGSFAVHCIEQWTDDDGIHNTDDAAHSGRCIPDLRCSIRRQRIYPGNQII